MRRAGRSLVPGAGLVVLGYHLGRGVAVRHLLARVTSEDPTGHLAPEAPAAAGLGMLFRAEHAADPHDKARCDHDHHDDDAEGGCCHRYPPPCPRLASQRRSCVRVRIGRCGVCRRAGRSEAFSPRRPGQPRSIPGNERTRHEDRPAADPPGRGRVVHRARLAETVRLVRRPRTGRNRADDVQDRHAPGPAPGVRGRLTETAGGALLAARLATPPAAPSLTGVMLTAIRKVHAENGIWNTRGGFEYNLVLIAALLGLVDGGPGDLCADRALGIHDTGPAWALAALAAGAAASALVVE